eukprot:scaffold30497_cov171-Skeletonema_menzelii.AAC.3
MLLSSNVLFVQAAITRSKVSLVLIEGDAKIRSGRSTSSRLYSDFPTVCTTFRPDGDNCRS